MLRVGLDVGDTHEIDDVRSRGEEDELHYGKVRRKEVCEDIHVVGDKDDSVDLQCLE